ncbi:hypothetical protein ACMYR2_2707 [Nitrobacter sp. TKz-YC01]
MLARFYAEQARSERDKRAWLKLAATDHIVVEVGDSLFALRSTSCQHSKTSRTFAANWSRVNGLPMSSTAGSTTPLCIMALRV